MTVTVVVPDFMGDLRTWLRGLADLNPYLKASDQNVNRVFFASPDNTAMPLIRLTEAGGGMQPGEAPLGDRRVLIEVIGGSPSDYYAVTQAKRIVESALHTLAGPIGAGTYVYNAQVDTVTDLPDPDTGAPRKVISAVLTVRSQ